MKENFYKQLLEQSPVGYAYHKIILDENSNPVDYEFIDVNEAFEKLTGLQRSDILGKNITEVLPDIKSSEFDWIKSYGNVALSGNSEEFEQFSESLNRWYKVKAVSPEKHYFITHFTDITREKDHIAELQRLYAKLRLEEQELQKSHERYKFLFEYSGLGIGYYKADGTVIFYNHKAAENMDGRAEDFEGLSIYQLFPKEDADFYMNRIKTAMSSESPQVYEDFISLNSGDKWFSSVYNRIKDANGNIAGVQIISQDITAKKQAEEDVLKSEKRFRELVQNLDAGVVIHASDSSIIDSNPKASELLGLSAEQLKGKVAMDPSWAFVNEDGSPLEPDEFPISLILADKKPLKQKLLGVHQSISTETVWLNVSGVPLMNNFGEMTEVVISFIDITSNIRKQAQIEYLSNHDDLTGLFNRRYYETALQKLDDEKYYPLTLIMADVNGLKLTNDAFGHKVGDLLLQKISNVLKRECREDDIVARIGGDEFVLLLPETDAKNAEIIINRINAAIKNEHIDNIILSVSIGYAIKKDSSEYIDKVFMRAEDDMYVHKLSESASMRSKTIDLIVNSFFENNSCEMLHSKRVSGLCAAIAREMNFPKDDVAQIKIAGLMHDIGKIGISEKTLNNPSSLNNEEWLEIKRHSEIGYKILGSVNEFSQIAEYILEHHEKLDGTGYPNRLKKDEILLQARIIAVADAFDAMISERPYSKALSEDEAAAELVKCSGTHFDPNIVKVFVEKVLGIDFENILQHNEV